MQYCSQSVRHIKRKILELMSPDLIILWSMMEPHNQMHSPAGTDCLVNLFGLDPCIGLLVPTGGMGPASIPICHHLKSMLLLCGVLAAVPGTNVNSHTYGKNIA